MGYKPRGILILKEEYSLLVGHNLLDKEEI